MEGKKRFYSQKEQEDSERHYNSDLLQPTQLKQDEFVKELQKKAESYIKRIQSKSSTKKIYGDFAIYTGIGGVALMYLRIYEHYKTSSPQDATKYFSLFKELVFSSVIPSLEKDLSEDSERRVTFLEGDTGAYALAAICLLLENKLEESKKFEEKLKEYIPIALETDSNELLYGKIGLLYSLLFVHKYTKSTWLLEEAKKLSEKIILLGKKIKSKSPLMYDWHKKQYLGAAHGLTGIIYVLLLCPWILEDSSTKSLILGTLDFLISLKLKNGNYPTRPDSSSDDLVQWCHGATGFGLLYCKCYEIFGDKKYLENAVQCAETIYRYGLLKKGLGLCHGISGNAYLFLYLHKITKDNKYMQWIQQFCVFSWGQEENKLIEKPDRPSSAFEGIAGTVIFYFDVMDNQYRFPAFEL